MRPPPAGTAVRNVSVLCDALCQPYGAASAHGAVRTDVSQAAYACGRLFEPVRSEVYQAFHLDVIIEGLAPVELIQFDKEVDKNLFDPKLFD